MIMKPVETYNGFFRDDYSVSDDGRVWSQKKKKFISIKVCENGYTQCCLYKNGIRKYPNVHQLVVEAFIRPYDRKTEQINHKNHLRSDNSLNNLQILSIGEHHQDEVTRTNMSNALQGKRTGKDNPHYGVPMSPEHKEKLRAINTGSKRSAQTIAKREETKRLKRLLDPNYGKAKNAST